MGRLPRALQAFPSCLDPNPASDPGILGAGNVVLGILAIS